jgi:hypothetical protein
LSLGAVGGLVCWFGVFGGPGDRCEGGSVPVGLVPGAWCPVPGAWCVVLGAWCVAGVVVGWGGGV